MEKWPSWIEMTRTSLVVQWLSICISNVGLLPSQGTKIPMQLKRKKKKKKWFPWKSDKISYISRQHWPLTDPLHLDWENWE